jgi:hypothetical protein
MEFLRKRADNDACASRSTEGCGFVGNSDLYGLGIRLGIYLQLLAMTLAMALLKRKGHDQVVTYNVFILSLLIALFVTSFDDQCVFEVELIMLQYIIWSGYFTMFVWLYLAFGKTGVPQKGSMMVISMSSYPIVGYSFYFWLSIVRNIPTRFTPTPCGTSYFLFARIDAHNFKPASTAILVFVGYLAACFVISITVVLGVVGYMLLAWIFKKKSMRNLKLRNTSSDTSPGNQNLPTHQDNAESRHRQRTDSLPLPYHTGDFAFVKKYPHLVAAAANFAVLIWTVIAVELPIRWNNISDVNTIRATGQFIPLITGIANLVMLLYKIWRPLRDGKFRDEHWREVR